MQIYFPMFCVFPWTLSEYTFIFIQVPSYVYYLKKAYVRCYLILLMCQANMGQLGFPRFCGSNLDMFGKAHGFPVLGLLCKKLSIDFSEICSAK